MPIKTVCLPDRLIGRTTDSGSVGRGSSPRPAAKNTNDAAVLSFGRVVFSFGAEQIVNKIGQNKFSLATDCRIRALCTIKENIDLCHCLKS